VTRILDFQFCSETEAPKTRGFAHSKWRAAALKYAVRTSHHTWMPCLSPLLSPPFTMEPTAGRNYRSPREKFFFPGFPGSRQGKANSGFFPGLLPRISFTGFSRITYSCDQCPVSTGTFLWLVTSKILFLVSQGVNTRLFSLSYN